MNPRNQPAQIVALKGTLLDASSTECKQHRNRPTTDCGHFGLFLFRRTLRDLSAFLFKAFVPVTALGASAWLNGPTCTLAG